MDGNWIIQTQVTGQEKIKTCVNIGSLAPHSLVSLNLINLGSSALHSLIYIKPLNKEESSVLGLVAYENQS